MTLRRNFVADNLRLAFLPHDTFLKCDAFARDGKICVCKHDSNKYNDWEIKDKKWSLFTHSSSHSVPPYSRLERRICILCCISSFFYDFSSFYSHPLFFLFCFLRARISFVCLKGNFPCFPHEGFTVARCFFMLRRNIIFAFFYVALNIHLYSNIVYSCCVYYEIIFFASRSRRFSSSRGGFRLCNRQPTTESINLRVRRRI